MHGLDLFSGTGGISYALRKWVRPVAYCENDRYAQSVLLSRMGGSELYLAPIWDDVRTLRGVDMPDVDIIYGGFPCQDISVAGNGAGLAGERSGLFLHMARLAEEIRPTFVFLENVPAIRTRGLSVVVYELARLGFDFRWTTVSAAEVGAPHLRRRFFGLAAHPDRLRLWDQRKRGQEGQAKTDDQPRKDGKKRPLAHSLRERWEERRPEQEVWGRFPYAFESGADWPTGVPEPVLRRGDDGLAHRVDRLSALGNGVVPLQAETAFKRLMGLH